MPTEQRGPPPHLQAGDRVVIGQELYADIVSCRFSRLLEVRFVSPHLEQNLYQHGKPIQYSYLTEELAVWDQQTIFSGPPISVEPPSASFPLTWELILALKKKNIQIAGILHGAGISSTGSVELDQMLPLTEWYDIPLDTVNKFLLAKQNQRQIVAVGTTVLRALESAWDGKELHVGSGLSGLKITSDHKIQTATALVTGIHEASTSHMSILNSFCQTDQIIAGYAEAGQKDYRSHEFGDIAFLHCRAETK